MGKIGDANSDKYCSVPQCKSRGTNEISLFRFPTEIAQKKRWADAMKIEKGVTKHMQVCSRHFVKSDYVISDTDGTKVRKLKKSAVPSQNLPWQFPNKRVSPTLAKARMQRLMNRSQQKTDSPAKSNTVASKNEALNEKNKTPIPKIASPKKDIPEPGTEGEVFSVGDMSVELQFEKDIEIGVTEDMENGDQESKDDKTPEDEIDMPRSAPTRLRNQKEVLKCELCGRKCLTPQALQTHQQIAHKNARNNQFNTKKESPPVSKTKLSPRPIPVALISAKKSVNTPKPLPKPIAKKAAEKSLDESDLVEKVLQEDSEHLGTESDCSNTSVKEDKVKIGTPDQTKTKFECPECRRHFAVYFMAYRHIQKHHPAQNGSKMANNLKPNRIEICTICNTPLDGNVHVCDRPTRLSLGFICAGCEQEYKTLTLFDMHKSSMHSDGVQSMFFSTFDHLNSWRKKMETTTKVDYSITEQTDTKKVYRCMHRTGIGSGSNSRQKLCPSSVVVQEFTKGYQVHYYPLHYDHKFEPYTLSEEFKGYSIASLMSLTANQLPDSDEEVQLDEDLYLQFKKVTDILVNEAARININGLKKLMRKALEMVAIVNSYVDYDDITTSSTIIKLDGEDDLQDQVKKALRSLKRRHEEKMDTQAKKKKAVFQSTENTPKGRTSNSSMLSKNEEIENECKLDLTPMQSPQKNQSPSFLGSFEDFVGKTLDKSTEKKKRKTIVKTKIGQFKPSPPKKALSVSPVANNSPISPRLSVGSVKDIQYEVKEQENDCNILILKI